MLDQRAVIDVVLEREGGYVNDPADSGGETNYGITAYLARSYGYEGAMRDLPRETAFDIYVSQFWLSVGADHLIAISEAVAAEVVDTSVNLGPDRAGKILQRALNVLNVGGTLYDDLIVDGYIGVLTLKALQGYLQRREEAVLVKALNVLQGSFYIDLAERRPKDERFMYGWFKKRVQL